MVCGMVCVHSCMCMATGWAVNEWMWCCARGQASQAIVAACRTWRARRTRCCGADFDSVPDQGSGHAASNSAGNGECKRQVPPIPLGPQARGPTAATPSQKPHLVHWKSLSATSLKPLRSKRLMMSPTRPRCTPSGLIITSARAWQAGEGGCGPEQPVASEGSGTGRRARAPARHMASLVHINGNPLRAGTGA